MNFGGRMVWIRMKVSLEDTILEVGSADNPVWIETPFKVVTFDTGVRPQENCFPNVLGVAEALPFKDKSFDAVCCDELLEHVPDPQAVLRETIRVARKKVVLTVPYEQKWPPALRPFWNPAHIRFYTEHSLKKELQKTGLPFSVEEITLEQVQRQILDSPSLLQRSDHRYFVTEPEMRKLSEQPFVWLGAVIFCGEVPQQALPQKIIIERQPERELVKINLGSFVDTIGHGFENWDILALHQHITPGHRFKQWDVRRGLPLADNSVDLYRASHLIEHLTLEEAKALLKEIHRTLRPGGIARISTPDMDTIFKQYSANNMGVFNAIQPPEYIKAPTAGERLSRLLFSGDYQHKTVYNFLMLKNFLEQAGLTNIERVGPGYSRSEVMMKETQDQHLIISLTVEASK